MIKMFQFFLAVVVGGFLGLFVFQVAILPFLRPQQSYEKIIPILKPYKVVRDKDGEMIIFWDREEEKRYYEHFLKADMI